MTTKRWPGLGLALVLSLLAGGAAALLLRPSAISAAPAGASPAVNAAAPALPIVREMLEQIISPTLYHHVAALSGEEPLWGEGNPYTLTTRYTWAAGPISEATAYAAQHLQALGLPTSFHPFTFYDLERRNVVAEQVGFIAPERIYLITAHIDSISYSGDGLAPGADDNASGVAAVLAIAEILSRYRFPYTIRYVLFSAEEQGMGGSWAYATEVAAAGDQIAAVLNLDMIAYNSTDYPEPRLELHTRPGDAGLPDLVIAEQLAQSITAYDLDLVPEIIPSGLTASDHAPFWDKGYPAILAIEDLQDFTPYYHKSTDRLSTLNMGYFTAFTQAALATLAQMAGATDFVYNPAKIVATYPVTFERLTTWDEPALSTTWVISDFPTASGPTAVYSFPWSIEPRSYIATLTVSSAMGVITRSRVVPVEGLLVGFETSRPSIDINAFTTFTRVVLPDRADLEYSWDFGDGSEVLMDSRLVITHSFPPAPQAAAYTVTLTAAYASEAASHAEQVQPHNWGVFLPAIVRSSVGGQP